MRGGQQPLERKEHNENNGAAPAAEELPQQQQSSAPPNESIQESPKPKPDADKAAIQQFLAHSQNTHTKAVTNSVGTAILKLRKRYVLDAQKSIDDLYKKCIEDLEAKANSDAELKPAIDYVIGLSKKESDYDKVTLDLHNDTKEEHIFRLKEVLTLVWEALRSGNEFEQNYSADTKEKRQEQALAERPRRLETFDNCLKSLKSANVCHHGNRNELIFVLNNIHKDVEVIEDARSTISTFLKDKINDAFKKRYQEEKENKKKLQASLFVWMESSDVTPILNYMNLRQEIEEELGKLFIDNGVSPKHVATEPGREISLTDMITEALQSLSFHCDPVKDELFYHIDKLINFESLNTPNDKKFEKRSSAVRQVASLIKNQFDLESKEYQEKLIMFSRIIEIHRNFYRSEFILELSGEMDSDTRRIIEACEDYFKKVEENGLAASSNITNDEINLIHKKIVSANKSQLKDKIENFFSLWFLSADNLKSRQLLYEILLNHETQEKIKLTDYAIGKFKGTRNPQGKLDITPYMINRIFLHAILVLPDEWSSEFESIFQLVFKHVNDAFDPEAGWKGDALKKDSYPDDLLKLLTYFKIERENYHLGKEDKEPKVNPRPNNLFLFPAQVKTDKQWTEVYNLIPENRKKQEYVNVSAKVDSYLIKIIKGQQEHKLQIISLISACRNIPEDCVPAFLEKLKKENADLHPEKLIKSIQDLNVIFEKNARLWGPVNLVTLSRDLKLLRLDVHKIITDIAQLRDVLKWVNQLDAVELIKAMGINPRVLIPFPCYLFSLLIDIREDLRVSFLKELREMGVDIRGLLNNFQDLYYFLYYIPRESRRQSIIDFGIEFEPFNPDNKDFFFRTLARFPKTDWGFFLKTVDLKMDPSAPVENQLSYLVAAVKFFSDTFSKNQHLVLDDLERHNHRHEDCLISEIRAFCFIRAYIITSTDSLITVLQMLPESERISFMQTMELEFGTADSLIAVLKHLPKDDRKSFIKILGVEIEKLKCTDAERKNIELLLPSVGGMFAPVSEAPSQQAALPEQSHLQRLEQK